MKLLAAGKTWLRDAWSGWDRFWFDPLHPASLSCLRILAGSMFIYTHAVWGLALEDFFGAHGWQDPLLVATFQKQSTAASFWWLAPADWIWQVHYFCLAVLVCFTLGLWTRLTSLLSLAIVISYAHRVPLATFGLDQINGLLALYLAIGPCGACYSLDALLRRRRSAMAAMRARRGDWLVPVPPSASTRLATRLVQVHMCLLYLVSGLAKLKGESWWDGTAIWLGAANLEYQSGDLTWLAWHPWLANFLTHATVFWEMTFWVFVWRPKLRPFVLLGGILMHLGIGAFLGMWTFGLVMIFTYVAFVPPETVLAIERRWLALWPQPIRVVEYGTAWVSRWVAAWRCAFSVGDPPALRLRSYAEPLSVPAPGTLAPALPGDWWRSLRTQQPAAWPFAHAPAGEAVPRNILVVSSRIALLSKLQQLLASADYYCRIATDVPAACAAIATHPCQCLVLCVHHAEELEDVRTIREMCLAAGSAAPVTISAINKELFDQVVWRPSMEHRLVAPPFSCDELLAEITLAWSPRAGHPQAMIRAAPTVPPAVPDQPIPRPPSSRPARNRPVTKQRITRR